MWPSLLSFLFGVVLGEYKEAVHDEQVGANGRRHRPKWHGRTCCSSPCPDPASLTNGGVDGNLSGVGGHLLGLGVDRSNVADDVFVGHTDMVDLGSKVVAGGGHTNEVDVVAKSTRDISGSCGYEL